MNPSSLDTSQAPPMPAIPKDRDKDDANRAISSSGSSKPSVMSYDGHLDFGIVGDRDTIPDLWRVIGWLREGLDELEPREAPETEPAPVSAK